MAATNVPVLLRPAGLAPWCVLEPAAKLLARGALPGAFGYDLAAHSFRCARAAGLAPVELLPAALPASWMVNSLAPSPVFRRWLTPPGLDAWTTLLARLTGEPPGDASADHASSNRAMDDRASSSRAMDDRASEDRMGSAQPGSVRASDGEASARWRREVLDSAAALCLDGHGLAALSKVLALLVPEVVPLLDDAAVWLLTGALPRPATADEPTAGPAHLLPSLAVFERSVQASEEALIALARDYPLAPLDAAQVLDRLVWFDAWGWRHGAASPQRAGWAWVADGEREGVVWVPPGGPERVPTGRLELVPTDMGEWCTRARDALNTARRRS